MKSKRIFKNYVTTLIGVAFLCFGAYLQHKGADAVSYGQAYTIGLLFIRSKDSLIGLKEKK